MFGFFEEDPAQRREGKDKRKDGLMGGMRRWQDCILARFEQTAVHCMAFQEAWVVLYAFYC